MYSTVHNSFIFQNESHSMLSLLRAWVQSLLEELLIKFHKLCRTVKINKWVSESIVIFLPPILIFSCFLFLLISHGTGLSILLIFSKNQLLALLIFSTVYFLQDRKVVLTKWHSVTGDAERYSQRRKYLRDAHNFELNLFFCIIEFDIWTENNIEQTNILCPLIILLICILIYIAKAVKTAPKKTLFESINDTFII